MNRMNAFFIAATSLACAAQAAPGGAIEAAIASPVAAHAVSADAAQAAIHSGATVVDIRAASAYAAGHVPGAVSAPSLAYRHRREDLQAEVSAHGIDLSRSVVIVGEPGDARAAALLAQLTRYATGRVSWLVGGSVEWALGGRPLDTRATVLAPVPQFLVALAPDVEGPRMASAHLRDPRQTPAAVASAL